MITVKSLINKSDAEARKAVSLIDAKFASLDPPFTPRPNASAGQLILAAHKAGKSNPFDAIKAVRNDIPRALRKARQPLTDGRQFVAALRKTADSLSEGNAPSDIPDELSFHLRIAQLGAKAGIIDPANLGAALREAADAAEKQIHAAERDFRRFESTAAIAAAKGASSYLNSCGPKFDRYAKFYAEKAETLVEQHRKAFAPDSLRRKRIAKRKGAK